MKKILLFSVLALSACALFSCKEETGITPNGISSLTAEPQEGAVLISWNKLASTDNVLYTRVDYDVKGEHKYRVVSNYANSLLVDNLLARYGTINFEVSTFSSDKLKSVNTESVSAQCEPVKPSTTTTFDRAVKESMKASTCSAYDNSKPENLFDGKSGTIFITPWENDNETYPQWIDFTFDRPINYIDFGFTKRSAGNAEFPNQMEILVSNDQKSWVKVFELSASAECPAGTGTYQADPIMIEEGSYKYVRYNVLSDNQGSHFWCLSEMTLDCSFAKKVVYDPENSED